MSNAESALISAAMRRACNEARQWVGATAPNPPVGAVALDIHGKILATAAHQRAGTDHAEIVLLKLCHELGLMERFDTLCVTLEPCNHTGKTPPCSDAIIQAQIRRVVIGTSDPNPHVKGGGAQRLRQAGIEVIEGIESDLCQSLLLPFAFHAKTGKPFVTIKRAFDSHGSMIPPAGQKTFTSRESLILSHRLRKKADAILTGSGTIMADNPLFNVRYVKDHADKRRILAILDRRGQVSADYIEQASQRGLDTIIYTDIEHCFSDLTDRGVRDVLVESGPLLSKSLLEQPSWTMIVDIHSGWADKVEVSFNPKAESTFDAKTLELEQLLPL